ncbi:hypothetical protein COCVIDRAFT_42887 [Bipolaris victoriae FI3]|uniref:Uncharacterized protein n=2 Tax=Bipolaris TaxID=33194 RepID=W6YAJ3_COCC2|nr:uncharacterized protein COCCADRAFT_35810 [Bipolaris zeicola 26-R-13]XP_014550645.1 hypothetical protein COCVIDRAFT_42887 [Bipolaris victoriae FI3]EUC34550.1 hypothetical protein COCCADRAFT_35810 [Bipolaris zeicola 26-R-13]
MRTYSLHTQTRALHAHPTSTSHTHVHLANTTRCCAHIHHTVAARLVACPAGQFSARGSRLAASKPSAADVHHHFPSLEKLTDSRYRPISAPSSSRVAGTDVQVPALAVPIWLLAT